MPSRQFSRKHISQLLAILAVVILIGVTLFVRYFPISADTIAEPDRPTITVTSNAGTSAKQVDNLYTMRLTEGHYLVESTTPKGRAVWYSLCNNCTEHSPNTYTTGTRVTITVPTGEYADIVWYYSGIEDYTTFRQMVDCSKPGSCRDTGNYEAYAPTIAKIDGTYHAFYCSAPDTNTVLQDYTRHTSSTDGKNWNAPDVAIRASDALGPNGFKDDVSACDPSLVYFNGYYYIYYGDAYETGAGNNQSVIHVARSQNVNGPYLKYTDRGTWEETPSDPKRLISPLTLRAQPDVRENHFYGAGQPSVIAKDGKLLMWYLDDSYETFTASNGQEYGIQQIYMLESSDGVTWNPDVSHKTELGAYPSSDIKYDPIRKKFILFNMQASHSAGSQTVIRLSDDGIHWETDIVILDKEHTPDFSNNIGVSGDEFGWLIPNEPALVAFGAPYDLKRTDTWGEWDLYGFFYNVSDAILTDSDKTRPTPVVSIPPTASPNSSANTLPFGFIDGVIGKNFIGWSIDRDTPNQSIVVKFYLDKSVDQGGSYLGQATANLSSPDVEAVTKIAGNHRYSFPIPESAYVDGKAHTVYAYGIDSTVTTLTIDGKTTQSLLTGSPKTFTLLVATPPPAGGSSPLAIPTAVVAKPTPTPTPISNAVPAITPTPSPIFCRILNILCPKPTSRATMGYLDGIDLTTGRAFGWTYDPDASSESISAEFYLDGPGGVGHLISRVTTQSASNDVNSAFKIKGRHRFDYILPEKAQDGTLIRDGKPHKLYVHGIDTDGTGKTNSPLTGTGKDFTLNATKPTKICRRVFIIFTSCTVR
jgi:hypothetical protein